MYPIQHILILAVRVYRWTLSPAKSLLFGPLAGCRYTPSCSEYALQALRRHGALAGSWLAVKRIARCHPWSECGADPVPGETVKRAHTESDKFHLPVAKVPSRSSS